MTGYLLCPNCREPVDPGSLACAGGHRFACEDGVLVLLQEEFGQQLRTFTAAFGATRAAENRRLLAVSAYEALPFGQDTHGDASWRLEWRLRRYDLAVVLGLLSGRGEQRILDVGAWNGWLSHQLAARGHHVTAIDYFTDEFDGLGARKFYSTDWQAIQIDLVDLSALNQRYDVVIVNRCLQFFTDPIGYVGIARRQLAPGGLLILTGLQLFQDARAKARDVAALRAAYQERYSLEVFLRPTKGYLDFADGQRLRAEGVRLRPYPQLWLANVRSTISKTLPRHCYGVCHNTLP
jgi:2-polyprenyl-3-methyl-5-hydroxy-6-metoxy-1,4-benzoquinol methylase